MGRPAAFIFDMDGVIIDSTATHVEAWVRYLERHGIEIDGIGDRMLGRHNDEIVREFFPGREFTRDEILAHGAAKEALYREMMQPVFHSRLVPGIAEFVRKHPEIPKAVATNAEPLNVDFVLELAGIRGLFRTVVSGHDVDRPKPFPDIFLRAAELLAAPPDRCIVFEDSRTGVAAARAAGMRVVGLTTTLTAFDNVDLEISGFRDSRLEKWLDLSLRAD